MSKTASALTDLARDLRLSLRQARRNKGFTAGAVFTLALGIGATTALFSVLHAVVLRPLPFPEAERLIDIATTFQGGPGAISVGNYFVMKDRARTFEAITARSAATFNLTDQGEAERVQGARVTPSYFRVFGLPAEIGHGFADSEEDQGEADVAVISHSLFIRRFGGDPTLLGRRILLSGVPHQVIGVMPADFQLPADTAEIWTPIVFDPQRSFDAHYLTVTARLFRNASPDQLAEDIRSITAAVREAAPRDNEGRTLIVTPLLDRIVGDYKQRLTALLGAVSLVFLIACVNVAGLLTARGAARRREIAVRAALGAGRWRIARQLMAEAILLSVLGGIVGLGLAAGALPILRAQGPADLPRLASATLEWPVVLTALAAAFIAAVVAGLLPALRASKLGLESGAASVSRGADAPIRDKARQAFVALEVGLSLMLLMGAGLLIRSARNLDRVTPGFEASNLLSARAAFPQTSYPGEERPADAVSRILTRLRSSPGVELAAASTRPPMIGDVTYGLRMEGREPGPQNRLNARMQLVTPGYLEALRVPVRAGRALSAEDRRGVTRVMVVNETLAHFAWPGQDPIGKRVACCEGTDDDPSWKEVVGVVADTRARGLQAKPLAEFYLPMDQAPLRSFQANGGSITFLARAVSGRPETLASVIRDAVRAEDPGVPLYDVATMASRVEASTAAIRFNRLLLSCLAVVGLVLAATGIYGVVAYLVELRTREIGVRLAIGALPRDVVGLIVRDASRAVGAGLLLGVIGSIAQGRAIESLLYETSGRDPMTLFLTITFLLVCGLAASAVPALRASRISPTKALAEP